MSSEGGTVRPSALAVLRLMMSSNLVGCSTGRSAALAPFQKLVDLPGGKSVQVSIVRSVRHETTRIDRFAESG